MTRYAVDAQTLLHLVASGTRVDGAHQLVATNAVRSQALQLLLDEVLAVATLQADALVTVDSELASTASDVVRLASIDDLTSS